MIDQRADAQSLALHPCGYMTAPILAIKVETFGQAQDVVNRQKGVAYLPESWFWSS